MSVAAQGSSAKTAEIEMAPGAIGGAIAIPDYMLYEVVDGQLMEKAVGARESEIASLLIGFLAPFLRAHRLGKAVAETLFRIDKIKDLQRRPDVAFVSAALAVRAPRTRHVGLGRCPGSGG